MARCGMAKQNMQRSTPFLYNIMWRFMHIWIVYALSATNMAVVWSLRLWRRH